MPDARTEFHLIISEPNLPPIDLVHQRADDSFVILISSIAINPEHQKKLLEVDRKTRDDFLWEIRLKLVSMNIEFRLEGADGPPTLWRIFSRLYFEKASIQDFWQAYLNIKNASFLVSWMYQRFFQHP